MDPPRQLGGDRQRARRAAVVAEALDELSSVLRVQDALTSTSDTDRTNLAKYLTIAKLKLENAIAVIRSMEPRETRS